MPGTKEGAAATPGAVSEPEAQPLQTVDEAVGDQLDLIKSLLEEPQTPATPEGNEQPEAAQTPDETPTAEAGERSESQETQPDDDEGGISPEIQAKIDKRIGREVAKTKAERDAREAAEARLAEAEARLAERQEQPPVASGSRRMPLETVQTAEQCAQLVEQAESAIAFVEDALVQIEENPEAVLADLAYRKVDLGPEPTVGKARAWLTRVKLNAERVTRKEVPDRLRYLQAEEVANKRAEELWPWWKDKTHADYAEAQSILRAYPEVKNRPHWRMVLGTYVEGMKTMRARMDKAVEAKPTATPKPQPGTPTSAAPAKPSAQDAKAAALRTRWLKNPSDRQAQQDYLAAVALSD